MIVKDIIEAARLNLIGITQAFEILQEVLGNGWQLSPAKTFGERVRAKGYKVDYDFPCYDNLYSLFAQYKAKYELSSNTGPESDYD